MFSQNKKRGVKYSSLFYYTANQQLDFICKNCFSYDLSKVYKDVTPVKPASR